MSRTTRIVLSLAGSTLTLGSFAPPAIAQEVNFSDTEKAKLRDLITIMYKLQCEAEDPLLPFETFEKCLSTEDNTDPDIEYIELDSSAGGKFDPTFKHGISNYFVMLRNNKLKKDNSIFGGGWTAPKEGLKDDEVGVGGGWIDRWCDDTQDPADRAYYKFRVLGTLANEMAHVYQVPEDVTDNPSDRRACDAERDSDHLSVKFLCRLLDRLQDNNGDPHTTLAGIEGEGAAGKCIAKCIKDLGVDTEAEIKDFHDQIKAAKERYVDRQENLFENQLDQDRSWDLLYPGRYKSPLRLKVNESEVASDRKYTLTYLGTDITITVPDDGKAIIGHHVDVDNNSCIVFRVITMGADGEICIHSWTDTNKDGLPGGTNPPVRFPPIRIPQIPGFRDAAVLETVPNSLGFEDGFMLHDRMNGTLTAYETFSHGGLPTGNSVELFFSEEIAKRSIAGDFAGNFYNVFDIHDDNGFISVTFSNQPLTGQVLASNAALGLFDIRGGQGEVFAGLNIAQALNPNNSVGVDVLPPRAGMDVVLSGNPLEMLIVQSVGIGGIQDLLVATAGNDGMTQPTPLPAIKGFRYDIVRVMSEDGQRSAQDYFWILDELAATGEFDAIDHDVTGDGVEEMLALVLDTRRLVIFEGVGDPFVPYQLGLELVVEDPHAFAFALPNADDPLRLIGGDVQIPLVPLQLAGPTILVQSLIDLDDDGENDDAFVVFRDPFNPEFLAMTVLDAATGADTVAQFFEIPGITPVAIEYSDLDGDGDLDVVIRDAGGNDLCLENIGDGTLQPGPCDTGCPADIDGDGDADADDFFAYLDLFASGDPLADLDGDGDIDADDFFAYLDIFVQGC